MYFFRACSVSCVYVLTSGEPKRQYGLSAIRNLILVSIPLYFDYRVYEKIMEKLKEIGQSVTGMKRKVANWAKGVALQGNINLEQGYVLLVYRS